MKLKLLRDDIGCCICEDCSYYSTLSKICTKDRKQADTSDICEDFKRAYEITGVGKLIGKK